MDNAPSRLRQGLYGPDASLIYGCDSRFNFLQRSVLVHPWIDSANRLVTALLAGFGRAAAEVGAIIIVGGNIDGFTRTMTTAIALETSKGDLPLAIGLGLVLIAIVIAVNAAAWGLRRAGERLAG